MAEGAHLRRLAAASLFLAAVLGGSCADGGDEEGFVFGAAMLESLCEAPNACRAEGEAERTTGLTADTVGFRLRGGRVAFDVDAIGRLAQSDLSFAEVQLLAARTPGESSTTLTATLEPACEGCVAPPPTLVAVGEEYRWVTVLGSRGFIDENDSSPLEGATLTVSGSGIDIAEMRVGDFFGGGCSVAPARRR